MKVGVGDIRIPGLGNFLSGMETEHLEYRGPAELLLPWKLP